jgi:hypothetical protein
MEDVSRLTTDTLEQELLELESIKARACARQVVVLREVDRRQVPLGDGCRTLAEWTAGRLDVTRETALRLTSATRLLDDSPLEVELSEGASFDRIYETARLSAAGASDQVVDRSRGFDLTGVRRLVAQHRRMSRIDEQEAFEGRRVMLQPSLDRSHSRLWGDLPSLDAAVFELALVHKADSLPVLPDGTRGPAGQRLADALVAIAADYLTSTSGNSTTRDHSGDDFEDTTTANSEPTAMPGPQVTAFVDLNLAANSGGQTGISLVGGPRIGVQVLEELLCTGHVELTGILRTDQETRLVAFGDNTAPIPPRLRRYVLARDGGCTASGCWSRYRLQPHHISHRADGGSNHPDNLTVLCWFHHHVVVHGMGYRIDPDSPAGNHRFLPPDRSPP